jgi:hypothetical protein
MKKTYLIFIFNLFLLLTGYSQADSPCSAVAYGTPHSWLGNDNSAATVDPLEVAPTLEDCSTGWCDLTLSNSLWFSFVANSENLLVSTCGSLVYDTQIAVYDVVNCSDYADFFLIKANDDDADCVIDEYNSTVKLCGLIVGSTYYIQVDAFDETSLGEFDLFVEDYLPGNVDRDYTVINASGDPTTQQVDVYFNEVLVANNLNFREGTITLTGSFSECFDNYIDICLPGSTNYADQSVFYTTAVIPEADVTQYVFHGQENPAIVDFTDNAYGIFQLSSELALPGELSLSSAITIEDREDLKITINNTDEFDTFYGGFPGSSSTAFPDETWRLSSVDGTQVYGEFPISWDDYLNESGMLLFSGLANPGAVPGGSVINICFILNDGVETCVQAVADLDEFTFSQFNVYPNPFQDQLILRAKESLGSIQLIDQQGKCLIEETCSDSEFTMNTDSLSEGIYFIKSQYGVIKVVK